MIGDRNGLDSVPDMFYSRPMTLPQPNPFLRLKARGSATNIGGRFEPYAYEAENDGWDMPEDERLLRTEVSEETPRSVINASS